MQRDLVERARKGDHDAFAELAGAAISRLDGAAWLMLRDIEQAKDAVQNALVRAWRDLPTLRDPDRFDAWLHRLLVHACIDEARRLRRHRLDVELTTIAIPSAVDDVSAVDDRDLLERGFLRLEPEMRAVIVLHHYLDLPMPAVATILGIPLGTAKSRLHRALARDARGARRRCASAGRSRGGPAGMTRTTASTASLSPWLHDDAAFRVPDHLDEVLSVTRETRQRPAWSSLERWLPVDTTFRPRLFSVPRAGRLAMVAALILLAAGDRDPRGRLLPTAAAGAVRTGTQRAHRHEP